MSRKLSTPSRLLRHQTTTTTTTTIVNASRASVVNEQQSNVQRWIFGMMTGSAPFLIILFGWMFVSVCLNNFVRLYQYRKKRHRRPTETNEIGNIVSKINI